MIKTRSPRVSWAVAKRFLIIFLPLSVAVAGVAATLYYMDARTERMMSETHEVRTVNQQKETIVSEFETIISDLMFLSQHKELQEMLDRGELSHREALSEEYILFSEMKRLYNQIRFLDETGMEVVRVDLNSGKPTILPEEQLQLKGNRYYFKETFRLGEGEVYVSPFDLNIERGEIEQPLKPIIRFGTPVFDSLGRKRGIVILNYLGARLIHHLEKADVNALGHVMLLNPDGFYLHSPRPEDEWGFMYEDGKDRTLENAFPGVWQWISGTESGKFYNAGGLFTFATVYPLLEVVGSGAEPGRGFVFSAGGTETRAYLWKIVSFASPDILNAGSHKFLARLLQIYAALVVLLAIGSWSLASATVHRRRTEEETHKLAYAVEQSPSMAIMTDTNGTIEYVNPKFIQTTGYTLEEVIGKNPRILNSGKTPPEDYKRLWDTITSGGEWRGEFRNKRKDGELYWEAVSISPIRSLYGDITHFLKVSENITERKLTDEKLQQMMAKLMQSNEELQQLAYVASHDLQEPLRKVTAFGNLLKDEYAMVLGEEGKDYLERMQSATGRMQRLIDDLLRLSRITTQAKPFEQTSLNTVVRELLHDLEESISQSKGRVETGELPALDADPIQMCRLFQNLIVNGLKYHKAGEPPMVILKSRSFDNGWCEITVEDQGIGFDERYLDRIFKPFQRLHGRDEFEGSGMGLAICEKIVRRHGGEITARSAVGKGSTFIVTLPLHQPREHSLSPNS